MSSTSSNLTILVEETTISRTELDLVSMEVCCTFTILYFRKNISFKKNPDKNIMKPVLSPSRWRQDKSSRYHHFIIKVAQLNTRLHLNFKHWNYKKKIEYPVLILFYHISYKTTTIKMGKISNKNYMKNASSQKQQHTIIIIIIIIMSRW